MRVGIMLGVLILWILLVPRFTWSEFISGVLVAFFAVALFGYISPVRRSPDRPTSVFNHIVRGFYALLVVVTFLSEVVLSAFRVAFIILLPGKSVVSEVTTYSVSLRSPVAVTFLSSMITLTPGTLAIDYVPETRTLYIHSLRRGQETDPLIAVRRLERLVRRVAE